MTTEAVDSALISGETGLAREIGSMSNVIQANQPSFFEENKVKIEFVVGLVLFAASAYYVMNSPFGKALRNVGKGIGTLIGVAEKLMGFAIFFLAPVMLAYKIYSVVAPDKAQKIEIEKDWAKETADTLDNAGIDPKSDAAKDIATKRQELVDKASDPSADQATLDAAKEDLKNMDEGIRQLKKEEVEKMNKGEGKLEKNEEGEWKFEAKE